MQLAENSEISGDGCKKALSYFEFKDCTSLIEFSIPKQVEYIESGAFAGCSSLKRIFMPASVNEIHEDVTFGEGQEVEIYYGGTEAMWNQIEIYCYESYSKPTITREEMFKNSKIYYNCDGLPESAEEL